MKTTMKLMGRLTSVREQGMSTEWGLAPREASQQPSPAPTSPGDGALSVQSIQAWPEGLVAWQSLGLLGKEFLHPPQLQGQVGPQGDRPQPPSLAQEPSKKAGSGPL